MDRAAHNPDRPPINDLGEMPLPAYHLLRMDRYTNLQPTVDRLGPQPAHHDLARLPLPLLVLLPDRPRQWRMRSAEAWRRVALAGRENWGAAEIGVLDDSFNIDRAAGAATSATC